MSNEYRDVLLENLYLEAIDKGMTDEEAEQYANEQSEKYGDLPCELD
tara:strand:- start:167 stop:307 length:141 start_codon:yes stop_codon:yes gene_type:complete